MLGLPAGPDPGLTVRFWGVRGSTSASGRRFMEFGGHTPCVEVRCGERLFVVDAGTGITGLGAELLGVPPARIDLLLSHLHLDHIGGLPFFKPLFRGGRTVRIHCGNLDGETAEAALERVFSPPTFPVRLGDLPGRIEHVGFRSGESLTFEDGAAVRTISLEHPGGSTGYRFAHRGRAVAYISDVEHGDPWPPDELVAFVRDADLVVYDGMFTETEYLPCQGWGHSTWEKGVALAQAAGVGHLAVFHLHPAHDDEALSRIEDQLKAAMPSAFLAREGMALTFAPER